MISDFAYHRLDKTSSWDLHQFYNLYSEFQTLLLAASVVLVDSIAAVAGL